MRILFMGTPEFALASLQELLAAGEEVVGVVTQPDRPRGRGKRVAPPAVKVFAQEQGLAVYQPKTLKDKAVLQQLQEVAPDVIIVVAYGKILPREVLELPPLGCINLHASLLPRFRGAAPIHWALIKGDEVTGVTTMFMDEGLDTGDIILQQEIPISPTDTAGTLHNKLAHQGSKLLVETLQRLKEGTITPIPQPEEGVSYAPPLERVDEILDWDRSARGLWLQVRGLNPWPGATTFWHNMPLKVWEVSLPEGEGSGEWKPGQVVAVDKRKGIFVQTGDGYLLLSRVQPAGKKAMAASDFARGYKVEPGMVFLSAAR